MALPTSRNQTYVAGSQVASADLNKIQDLLVAYFKGDVGAEELATLVGPLTVNDVINAVGGIIADGDIDSSAATDWFIKRGGTNLLKLSTYILVYGDLLANSTSVDLGTAGSPFGALHLAGDAKIGGDVPLGQAGAACILRAAADTLRVRKEDDSNAGDIEALNVKAFTDLKHGSRTLLLHASEGQPETAGAVGTPTYYTGGGGQWRSETANTSKIVVPVDLKAGDRIQSMTVWLQGQAGASAGAQLSESNPAAGTSSTPLSFKSDTSGSIVALNWTGAGDGLPYTLLDDRLYRIIVTLNPTASAGDGKFLGAKIVYDRP